ncbi:hypothetical protein PG985_015119 [Apiospora marii]|uniref:uncharacterized protein n=1 Tax=Apiospora marii TaxID=335849 RepID=UPI00312E1B11
MGAPVPAPAGLLQDLSLAGDILAFVQLGTELLTSSKGFEGKAGEELVEKGHNLVSSAISRCRLYESKFQWRCNSHPNCSAATTTAVDLHTICGESYSAARVLRQNLEKTQTREEKRSSRGWSGLKAALAKVWSKKGMHEEVMHLRQIKCSIENETFRSIASTVTPTALKESPGFLSLEPEDRELIVALSGGLAPGPDATMTSTQIRAMCLVLSRSAAGGGIGPSTDRRPSVLSIAASSCRSSRRSSISTKTTLSYDAYGDPLSPTSAHSCSFDETTAHKETRRRNEVSQHLRNGLVADSCSPSRPPAATATSRHRDEGISDGSHHDTYDAVLPEDHVCGLRSWLQEPGDHRVYWIEGPRGSGKSALMESISTYVCSRGVTASNDEDGGTKRIVVKFTPSTSPAGRQGSTPWATELARSMLYEILGQDPSLIPLVFPREWSDAYCKSLGYTSSSSSPPISTTSPITSDWTFHQLKAAVDWLFTQPTIPFRAILLIDSLDDFYEAAVADEGANHAEIDEIVRYMIAGRWKNAQCCISTRPSAPVAAAFRGQPALRMTELTRPAMREYALNRLSSHAAFRDLGDLDHTVLHQCVEDIVDAADGVFLWAQLAISTVMRDGQHTEGSAMQEVQGRIRSLPRRLEDLYKHIIATKSRQSSKSRILFQLVAVASRPQEDDWTALSPLSLLELWFALDDDAPMLAVAASTGFLTQQEVARRRKEMASRLPELSGGLIKVEGDVDGDPNAGTAATVSFINDSAVAAFFDTSEVEAATTTFNLNLAILSAIVLSLKTERLQIASGRDRLLSYHRRSDIDHALLYARRAEAELGYDGVLNHVVDALIETATTSRPYWFQLNDAAVPNDDKDHHQPGGYTTKHVVAARCGLHQYLRHLLSQDDADASPNNTPSQRGSHKQQDHLPHHQRHPSSSAFSPNVVRTLLTDGAADVTDAGPMLIEFLTEEDLPNDRHLLPWKTLLLQVLPLQRRLYQTDLRALKAVFARRPGDWAEVRAAVRAAAVSIRGGGGGGRRLGLGVQKRVLWIFDQLAEA